jgi:hypothetical protein
VSFQSGITNADFRSNPNFASLVSTDYSVFPSIIGLKRISGQAEFRDLIPPAIFLISKCPCECGFRVKPEFRDRFCDCVCVLANACRVKAEFRVSFLPYILYFQYCQSGFGQTRIRVRSTYYCVFPGVLSNADFGSNPNFAISFNRILRLYFLEFIVFAVFGSNPKSADTE